MPKDKNREYLEKLLTKNVNICYMTKMKSFIHKLKSNYDCDPEHCPVMQKRLYNHRLQYHPELFQWDPNTVKSQTKISNLRDLVNSFDTRPAATNTYDHNNGQNIDDTDIYNNRSIDRSPKLDVDKEVKNWIKKLPYHPDESAQAADIKENLAQQLIDNIHSLEYMPEGQDHDLKIKHFIDKFLDSFPVWYPDLERDQMVFKEGLRENLFHRIQRTNRESYDNQNGRKFMTSNLTNDAGQRLKAADIGASNIDDVRNLTPRIQSADDTGEFGSDDRRTPTEGGSFRNTRIFPFGNNIVSPEQPSKEENFRNTGIYPFRNNIGSPGMNHNPSSNISFQKRGYTNLNLDPGNLEKVNDDPKFDSNFNPYSKQMNANPYIDPNNSNSNPSYNQGNTYPRYDSRRASQENTNLDINARRPSQGYINPNFNAIRASQLNTDVNYDIRRPSQINSNLPDDSNYSTARRGSDASERRKSVVIDHKPNVVIYGTERPYSGNIMPNNKKSEPYNEREKKFRSNQPGRLGDDDNTISGTNRVKRRDTKLVKNEGIDTNVWIKQEANNNSKNISNDPNKESIRGTSPSRNFKLLTPNMTRNSSKDNSEGGYTRRLSNTLPTIPQEPSSSVDSHYTYYKYLGEDGEEIHRLKHQYPTTDKASKCTIVSEDLCACPSDRIKTKKKKPMCGPKYLDIEKEVADWLAKSSVICDNVIVSKRAVIEAIVQNIKTYLDQPYDNLNKAVLKGKVVAALKRLGICTLASGTAKSRMFKLADELANRLVGIRSRLECTGGGNWRCRHTPFEDLEMVTIGPNEVRRIDLKHDLMQEIRTCLQNTNFAGDRDIEHDLTELLIDKVELIRKDLLQSVRKDVHCMLDHEEKLEEPQLSYITENIIRNTRNIIITISNIDNRTDFSTTLSVRTVLSGVLSIYTLEHEANLFTRAGSSGMEKKESILKLTPEEEEYTDKVADEIMKWLKKVPDNFNRSHDTSINEMISYDLASDIVDHIKIKQLVTDPNIEKKYFMTIYVYKWLIKYRMLKNLDHAEPHTQALVSKLEQIKFPNLSETQEKSISSKSEQTFGTRKSQDRLKKVESAPGSSKLGHKRQSQDKSLNSSKGILIKEVMLKDKPKDTNKRWTYSYSSDNINDLESEISTWMNEQPLYIYKNPDKSIQEKQIHEIAGQIKKTLKIKKSDSNVRKHIDKWLRTMVKEKEKQKIRILTSDLLNRIKALPQNETLVAKVDSKAKKEKDKRKSLQPEATDATMKQFIIKYIEHDCETHDSLTKEAYSYLLNLELKMINPVTRERSPSLLSEIFSAKKLTDELEYIKRVSDWLKNPLVQNSFNIPGNQDRAELVIRLAKSISDAEDEWKKPGANPKVSLEKIVNDIIKKVPTRPEQSKNLSEMVDQLVIAIIKDRHKMRLPKQYNADTSTFKVLKDIIKTDSHGVSEDELKLEAWSGRLIEEIKKAIHESDETGVSDDNDGITSSVTVERFILKLDYIDEITDWLKNLPIAGPIDPVTPLKLAQKMIDHDDKKICQKELFDFIKQWLGDLPLDPQKDIDVPLLTSQLMKRKQKVKSRKKEMRLSGERRQSTEGKGRFPARSRSSKRSSEFIAANYEAPGEIIVKVVENWCHTLPLQGAPVNELEKVKIKIENQLFQKIAELNDNPRLIHDDELFKGALSDEVQDQLTSLPPNATIKGQNALQSLISQFVNQISEAKHLVNNISAGDTYRQNLEDTLQISLPNPVQGVECHPGFDLYTTYVVDMFILQNYDHVSDKDKLKYEKKIEDKIHRYAHNAQERNVVLLPRDHIYNELYASLYKVPLPDKESLVADVEEIKTKYEIYDWYYNLPGVELPDDDHAVLNENKKITYLAKELLKLYKDQDANEKINRRISRWLQRVPVTGNVGKFANDLIERLTRTEESRKCVQPKDLKSADSKIVMKLDEGEVASGVCQCQKILDSVPVNQKPKSGNLLIREIDHWCRSVPLPSLPKNEAQMLRLNLSSKLIMKVSQMNSDPRTFNQFNEDIIYMYLLNEELDKLLSDLPPSEQLAANKERLKNELINALISVKPLILEEKARHTYRKDLDDVCNQLLYFQERCSTNHCAAFHNVKENIIDNFIEYQFHKNDDERKHYDKLKIIESIMRYNPKNLKNLEERRAEALCKGNQVLVELSKISPPSHDALREEVAEIRMKTEVEAFLNHVSPTSKYDAARDQLRNSLAKELYDIEKSEPNDVDRMKNAVKRATTKLRVTVGESEIDNFLKMMIVNQKDRKISPAQYTGGSTSQPASRRVPFTNETNAQSMSLPVAQQQAAGTGTGPFISASRAVAPITDTGPQYISSLAVRQVPPTQFAAGNIPISASGPPRAFGGEIYLKEHYDKIYDQVTSEFPSSSRSSSLGKTKGPLLIGLPKDDHTTQATEPFQYLQSSGPFDATFGQLADELVRTDDIQTVGHPDLSTIKPHDASPAVSQKMSPVAPPQQYFKPEQGLGVTTASTAGTEGQSSTYPTFGPQPTPGSSYFHSFSSESQPRDQNIAPRTSVVQQQAPESHMPRRTSISHQARLTSSRTSIAQQPSPQSSMPRRQSIDQQQMSPIVQSTQPGSPSVSQTARQMAPQNQMRQRRTSIALQQTQQPTQSDLPKQSAIASTGPSPPQTLIATAPSKPAASQGPTDPSGTQAKARSSRVSISSHPQPSLALPTTQETQQTSVTTQKQIAQVPLFIPISSGQPAGSTSGQQPKPESAERGRHSSQPVAQTSDESSCHCSPEVSEEDQAQRVSTKDGQGLLHLSCPFTPEEYQRYLATMRMKSQQCAQSPFEVTCSCPPTKYERYLERIAASGPNLGDSGCICPQGNQRATVSAGTVTLAGQQDRATAPEDDRFEDPRSFKAVPILEYCESCEDYCSYFRPVPVSWI